MDPKLQAQLSVRQQAEDLQDYLKDLFGWQKELKEKEKNLKKGATAPLPPVRGGSAAAAVPAAAMPAVPTPPPGAAAAAAAAAVPGHPAGHTYDHYRQKWKKFDVDAALASDDEGELAAGAGGSGGGARSMPSRAAVTSPASNSTAVVPATADGLKQAAPLPAARIRAAAQADASRPAQPTTAEGFKDEGNRLFKAGQYQQAAECYSASLALAPSCLAFANRAMAELKLREHRQAEEDCTQALLLDPAYVKAYQRRATARRELGDLLGAIEDLEAALRWEPANKATAVERQQCVAQLLGQQGLAWSSERERVPLTAAAQLSTGAAAGNASAAPPGGPDGGGQLMAASSSRRLGGGGSGSGSSGQGQAQAAAAPAARLEAAALAAAAGAGGASLAGVEFEGMGKGEEEPLPALGAPQAGLPMGAAGGLAASGQLPAPAGAAGQPSGSANRAPAKLPQAAIAPVTEVARALEAVANGRQPTPAQEAPQGAAGGAVTLAPAAAESPPTGSSAGPPEASAGSAGEAGPAAVTAAVAGALKRVAPAGLAKAPRTGLEFEKAWKACKGDPSLQADCLLLIPPVRLPVVLKQTLTPALLAALLRTLLGAVAQRAPGHAAAALEVLRDVPRFDMNLMSLSAKEKEGLGQAWGAAQAHLEAGGGEGKEFAARLAAARGRYGI